MLANISDPFRTKTHLQKPSNPPLKTPKKQPPFTRSHKSFLKDPQIKLAHMLQMNQKYQRQLVNHEFYKMLDLERYSPKRHKN
jgi:hypothetical protein